MAVPGMKIVLRHKVTGRYYHGPGLWVRRADNALAFDDMPAAQEFTRAHQLGSAQPVQRLAPYLMSLLRTHRRSALRNWCDRGASFYLLRSARFWEN